MANTVTTEIQGAVLEIVLNRPEKRNAMNAALLADLKSALAAAEAEEIRAVLLRAEGPAFCVGGDITVFSEVLGEGTSISRDAPDLLHSALVALRSLRKPVLAAVNGACAGAGVSLMLSCDLAIAADNAKFFLAYLALGTSPDGGSTYFLPRHVGMKKAFELFTALAPITPQAVAELGLINRVVPAGRLLVEARQMAAMLAMGPTQAMGRLKQLLTRSHSNSFVEQLDLESVYFAESTATQDFGEGVAAFMAKRMPSFKGK